LSPLKNLKQAPKSANGLDREIQIELGFLFPKTNSIEGADHCSDDAEARARNFRLLFWTKGGPPRTRRVVHESKAAWLDDC
jgi:hypothetical protein